MVPVLNAEDGQWLLPKPLQPMMKPGGHGAIWKLMLDEGVFDWLSKRRREAAIVRQIR
jgi:UDP-N-acetylglucosamine pyrophosphorylase